MYEENKQYYNRSDTKNYFREYLVLKQNVWTSIIHEHFFEKTRLSCPIDYKRAKIFTNRTIFLNIIGHCSLCLSNFKGIESKSPETDSRVVINCSYIGKFKFCNSEKKNLTSG